MRLWLLLALAGCTFQQEVPSGVGDAAPTADARPDGPPGCTAHALPPAVNVNPFQWSSRFLTAPVWNCTGAGTTTVDTATGTVTNPCGPALDFTNDVVQSSGGGGVFVARFRGLTVTNSHILRFIGNKPVVVFVAGDVIVDSLGIIDVGANAMTPGPGGMMCPDRANGAGVTASGGGWGGGGGGFGTAGGQGGYNNVNGGALAANQSLTPLRGGCAGAPTVGSNVYGAGGGAIEISATGTISIGPTGQAAISAAGGGAPLFVTGGGNGGGSGGGILLVAPTTPTFGAGGAARAHGGSGSSGDQASSTPGTNLAGRNGHVTDNMRATDTSGTAGTPNNDRGRAGGLASFGSGGPNTQAGDLPNAQSQGGRGGGGGGGGVIVVTTGTTSMGCD